MKRSKYYADKIQSIFEDAKNTITIKTNKNINKQDIDNVDNIAEKDIDRGMSDNHSPIYSLDLTGMTREQAKAEIGKLIDERIGNVASIQMSEMRVDALEKEREKINAAERINERRNKRKEREKMPPNTVFTEQGVYSDYKTSSVFDIIQPETFPLEEDEKTAEAIIGQLSILDLEAETEDIKNNEEKAICEIEAVAYNEKTDKCEAGRDKSSADSAEIAASTTVDAAIDKVFALFGVINRKTICIYHKAKYILEKKVLYFLKTEISPRVQMGIKKLAIILQLEKRVYPLLRKLPIWEKAASEKMCAFITFLDSKNDKLSDKINASMEIGSERYHLIREYAEHHKKKIVINFAIGAVAVSVVMLAIGSMTAYEYIYNGKVLGVVDNQEDVYKTVDIIGDKLSYEYNAEITIDPEKDITFKKIIAMDNKLDSKEDILNSLTYMKDMKAKGHGIYVEGKLVATVESKETADDILQEIKNGYLKNDNTIKYQSIGFKEKVVIKDLETKLGNIQKKENVLEYMMTGATAKKIHAVKSGETFSEIAKMYGMKQSELSISNPGVIPEKLKIGQEISLTQAVPVATVQTVEVATYKETIPYQIAYENTSTLYQTEQTVKSRGSNGQREVVAEITRNNGIEAERTELSSKVLIEPASQVVLVGTKKMPALIGTGTFIYPVRGTLTSRYGYRWGRLHAGIDLGVPTGTNVKAADGGTVIFSGYNGSLGYMVKINHGGGRVSLYGHCSKLLVKSGTKVYQGQIIAKSGNTGRSTGPHVHFQVEINGNAKNPLNYL